MSDVGRPNGGVPQGTLSGPVDFLVHVNDLTTTCPTFKYVDDCTIFDIGSPAQPTSLQSTVDMAVDWSRNNDMKVNVTKTKEMLVYFGKSVEIPPLLVDGQSIERVKQAKLLGLNNSSDLTWNGHVHNIISKAGKRLY